MLILFRVVGLQSKRFYWVFNLTLNIQMCVSMSSSGHFSFINIIISLNVSLPPFWEISPAFVFFPDDKHKPSCVTGARRSLWARSFDCLCAVEPSTDINSISSCHGDGHAGFTNYKVRNKLILFGGGNWIGLYHHMVI